MKKFLGIFVTCLAAVMLLSSTVSAVDSVITYKGIQKGFTVEPGSEYSDTDLFDGFKGVMPGDRLTEVVKIRNLAEESDYIKLYIRAVAHDEENNPLSEGVAASGETVMTMSEFLAQLTMRVYNEDELIFDGTPNETDGLTRNV